MFHFKQCSNSHRFEEKSVTETVVEGHWEWGSFENIHLFQQAAQPIKHYLRGRDEYPGQNICTMQEAVSWLSQAELIGC